jgi:hypothetical protein
MADLRDTTPTKEDLLKLPRWAKVTFAARCARRARPLFNAWKGAPERHIDAIDRAIALSEASARLCCADATLGEAASAVYHAYIDATKAVADDDLLADAAFAAHIAFLAIDAASTGETAFFAHYASDAPNATIASIWSDYNRLLALSREEAWTDATPVDVNRLGTL